MKHERGSDGSKGLEGVWLSISEDGVFVDELVLSEGKGTLKRSDENDRVSSLQSLEVLYDLLIPVEEQGAEGAQGRTRVFQFKQSQDGSRVLVHLSAQDKRLFTKSALFIKELCAGEDLEKMLRLGRYFWAAGSGDCVPLFTEAARRGSALGNLYLGHYYYTLDKDRAFDCYLNVIEQYR